MQGGAAKLQEAGCALLGGHSVRDPEIKFGYAITGLVDPQRMLTNAAGRAGDVLVLTKPLGTGVIATALKAGEAPPRRSRPRRARWRRLNRERRRGGAAARGAGGHRRHRLRARGPRARTIARESGVTLEIESGAAAAARRARARPDASRRAASSRTAREFEPRVEYGGRAGSGTERCSTTRRPPGPAAARAGSRGGRAYGAAARARASWAARGQQVAGHPIVVRYPEVRGTLTPFPRRVVFAAALFVVRRRGRMSLQALDRGAQHDQAGGRARKRPRPLARRYARALLDVALAQGQGRRRPSCGDLGAARLRAELEAHAAAPGAGTPTLAAEAKKKLVTALADAAKASPLVRRLVERPGGPRPAGAARGGGRGFPTSPNAARGIVTAARRSSRSRSRPRSRRTPRRGARRRRASVELTSAAATPGSWVASWCGWREAPTTAAYAARLAALARRPWPLQLTDEPGRDERMEIRADEITKIIREQLGGLHRRGRRRRGRHRALRGRRHRPHPRPRALHGGRAPGAAPRRHGPRPQPRGGLGRRGALRARPSEIREGDAVKRTNASCRCRWATRMVGRVVNALGQPIDGKGPINTTPSAPSSASRPASSTASR